MEPGDAGLGEGVGGELVGDLEALGLGVGGPLDARDDRRPARRCPGTLVATNRMPPTVRRMQIEGIIAIRSVRPVSCASCMKRSSSSVR